MHLLCTILLLDSPPRRSYWTPPSPPRVFCEAVRQWPSTAMRCPTSCPGTWKKRNVCEKDFHGHCFVENRTLFTFLLSSCRTKSEGISLNKSLSFWCLFKRAARAKLIAQCNHHSVCLCKSGFKWGGGGYLNPTFCQHQELCTIFSPTPGSGFKGGGVFESNNLAASGVGV